MNSTFRFILGALLCHIFAYSAAAQSMAEKWKTYIFDPERNLQVQLEEQQSAHDRSKDLVAMVSIYTDPKNMLITMGYSVSATGHLKSSCTGR